MDTQSLAEIMERDIARQNARGCRPGEADHGGAAVVHGVRGGQEACGTAEDGLRMDTGR